MRVLQFLVGVLLAVGATVTYIFGLLPSDAPSEAGAVLFLVGFVGFLMAGEAA